MRALLLATALFSEAFSQAPRSSGPPAGFEEQFPPITSAHNDFVAEFYVKNGESPRQLWIRSVQDRREATLLTEYERNASVVFSPSEEWIAVNDELGSNISEVRLFHRVRGTHFEEVKNVQPTEQAWALLVRTHNLRGVPDHSYVEAIRWAPDSAAVLLVLSGHDDQVNINDWFCVFDLRTSRASVNLELMNRRRVVK